MQNELIIICVDNCVNNCVDINIDSKSVMSGGNTTSHGNQILFKGIEQSCVIFACSHEISG